MWHMQLKDALEPIPASAMTPSTSRFDHPLLAAMLVLRRSWRSPVPWLFVFALEAANELLDLQEQYEIGIKAITWQQAFELGWPEGLKDMVNTMLWPTALLLVGRYTRLFGPRDKQEPPTD